MKVEGWTVSPPFFLSRGKPENSNHMEEIHWLGFAHCLVEVAVTVIT